MIKRSLKEVLEIYEKYLEGVSLTTLDKIYKTDSAYLFKKHKLAFNPIGRRILKGHRTHNMIYDFKIISSPKEAYFLGLLYADGYVSKMGIGLTLKNEDSYIIEELSKYVYGYIKPLRNNKANASTGIMLYSLIMKDNLANYQLVPQKTNLAFSIPNISSSLIPHFIRGYFDGDGSVFTCTRNNQLAYLKANICSPTISILEDIQRYLKLRGIESTIDIEKRKGLVFKRPGGYSIAKHDMYRLFIRKKSELYKFYQLLYNDADIYLKRKYNTFANNIKLMSYK